MKRARINPNTTGKQPSKVANGKGSNRQIAKPQKTSEIEKLASKTEAKIEQGAKKIEQEAGALKDKLQSTVTNKVDAQVKAAEANAKNQAKNAVNDFMAPDSLLSRGPQWWKTFLRCGAPDPKVIQQAAQELG